MMKDCRGYIVVETIVTFVLLALLMASIISLAGIVSVQSRIHFALTQTAETLSMYSYTLDVTGAADHIMKSAARADEVQQTADQLKTNLNAMINSIKNLSPDDAYDSADALLDQAIDLGEKISANPKDMIQNVLNYGLNEAGQYAFGNLVARPIMARYLENGVMSADEYLKAFHVVDGLKGLSFYKNTTFDLNETGNNNGALLTKDGTVKIVVQYDIDYSFAPLPLPEAVKTLHVTQEVETKAWLGGSGEGYQP